MERSVRLGACRYYAATAALSVIMGVMATSALGMPHSTSALKTSGVAGEVGCREMTTRTRDTCYRDVTTKQSYECPHMNRQDACRCAPAHTGKSSTREMHKGGGALCSRTRLEKQCKSVAGTCYRKERQVREYPCLGPEVCTFVPTEVERVCVRRSTRPETYPCEKHKFDRICTSVQVPVDKVCHREETRTRQYPCKKTEYQRVCRSIVADIPSTEICFKTVMREEEYACTKTELKRTCSRQPVGGTGTCTRVSAGRGRFPCTRKVIHQRCKDGIVRRPAMCSRTVKVKQPYECGETETQTDCTPEPACKDHRCKMRRLHHAPCQTTSILRSKTCYREVDEVQEYPCVREKADGCILVEEEVADTCTESARSENFSTCTGQESQEKCKEMLVEVPSTCQREVPVQEAYPCPGVLAKKRVCEHQPVEIEDTCREQVTVQVPYNCEETETRTECKKARVTYTGTCHRTVPKKEEYPCTGTEKKRQCNQEQRVCSERVLVEVPYECSRNVCEHVEVPTDTPCSKSNHSLKECSNSRKGCSDRELAPQICFRDVVARKAFPCYKTNITTVCNGPSPQGPLLLETSTKHL